MTFSEQIRQRSDEADAAHQATLSALENLASASGRYRSADRDLRDATKSALELSVDAMNRYNVLCHMLLHVAFDSGRVDRMTPTAAGEQRGGAV